MSTIEMYFSIIERLQSHLNAIVKIHANNNDDLSKFHFEIKYSGEKKNDVDRLQARLTNLVADGLIQIWLNRKSMDISVYSLNNAESLFEFHDTWDSLDTVLENIDKAIAIFH